MPLQNVIEIIERCKGGDTTAFRMLMQEHQHYAYAVAFRMVSNEDEAEDIVQEAFIRIWNSIGRYKREVKFTTWMYAIVTNLCLDALRSGKRRPHVSLDDADVLLRAQTASDDEQNPETLYGRNELAAIIQAAKETLPPRQKIIFILRDMQDLSIREVCDILGCSEGAVKTNLVYARRSIREQLERNHIRRD